MYDKMKTNYKKYEVNNCMIDVMNNLKENKNEYIVFVLASIVTILLPLPSVLLNIYMLTKTKSKKYVFLLCIILSLIAFHSIPSEEEDLFRHFILILRMKDSLGYIDALNYGYYMTYVNTTVMYFANIFGNPGLYTAIFVFIGYYLLFLMTLKEWLKTKISTKYFILILAFVFILSFFRVYVFAIRNYAAFIISIYAIYRYEIEKKDIKISILIFVSSIMIHLASLIFIPIWILLHIKNNNIKKIIFPTIIIGQVIFYVIYPIILKNINFFMFDKLYQYMTEINAYNVNFYMLYTVSVFFFCWIIYLIYKKEKNLTLSDNLIVYSLGVVIAVFYKFEFVRRFIFILYCLSPLCIFKIISIYKNDKKIITIIVILLLALMIIGILATIANIKAYGWDFDIPIYRLLVNI